MESRFLLDVVVGERSTILKLLASEDETLLIWGNSLLILDLGFDILDGIRGLHLESDGLASEGLDKDLHSATESQNEVESRFLLDVVVGERSTILKLFTSEDETLLIWGDSLLVLDLGLDILDGIRGLNLQCNGLASKSLDKDLHASTKSEDQMESRFLLDVVVRKGSTILKLLSSEDETLLIWRNSLLVLDLGFDILDG